MRKSLLSFVIALMPVVAVATPAYVESRTKEPSVMTTEKDNLLSLMTQLNAIQEEVQQLRGLLEQQQFEIDQLKAMKAGHPSVQLSSSDPSSTPSSTSSITTSASGTSTMSEKDSDGALYEVAYQHLQNRQYNEALEVFNRLIAAYGDSKYSINARYWTGEIYLLQGDSAKAKEAFNYLIVNHPDHQKTADALLKLGYIAYNTSNREESIQRFTEVKKRFPGSSSARLAQTRLDAMRHRS